MKITSSKNNYQFSDNEHAYITMSANQTTEIAAGNLIKLNTLIGNITLDPATYRVTLKKNRTYILRASLQANFSGAAAYVEYIWYNITASANIGKTGTVIPTTYASNSSAQTMAVAVITPTVDTVIDLRITVVSNLSSITTAYSFAEIQQINIVSPVIPDPTRDYAYVSPWFLLTVAGANWTTIRAVGQFFKLNNGVWKLKFNLCGTLSSGSSVTLTFTGVTFKTISGGKQALTFSNNDAKYALYCQANSGVATIEFAQSAASAHVNSIFGSVELDAKPTGFGIPSDL